MHFQIHKMFLPIGQILVCKKLRFSYILQKFLFEIWIWFWAVENLGSSHHASVIGGRDHALKFQVFYQETSKLKQASQRFWGLFSSQGGSRLPCIQYAPKQILLNRICFGAWSFQNGLIYFSQKWQRHCIGDRHSKLNFVLDKYWQL